MSASLEKTIFSECIRKTLALLHEQTVDYFLLGGVALPFLGEPRLTRDMDVDIFLTKDKAVKFLKKAKLAKFKINMKAMEERIMTFGNFRIFYKDVPVDMIIASTELENSALKRKRAVTLYGEKTYVPSPEDFILLKIIPGRPQDMVDAESVVLKNSAGLDRKYLEKWAKTICDEMENFRVLHQLRNLLKAVEG